MTRRTFLLSSFAAAVAAPPPNVVVILADDLGWNDVGWHNPDVRTPNLDALAARGVRFEQYRVNAVCSPTRASLLTGRTAFRAGVPTPIPDQSALPAGERLLPQMLSEIGYQT